MKLLLRSFLVTFFLGIYISLSFSQSITNSDLIINYTNPANLKACDSDDTLVLLINNISSFDFDVNSFLEIQLPDGVSIVGDISNEFVFDNQNLSTNTYTYLNPSTHLSSSVVELKLVLRAECAIFDLLDNTSGSALSINNSITFSYEISGSSYTLNGSTLSYNVAQANIKTTVPSFNQTLTVPNDYSPFSQVVRYDVAGNSSLDEFNLHFNLPLGLDFNQIDSVKVNGVNLSGYTNPMDMGGGNYQAFLNAALLGVSMFNSGDVIFVYYNYTPNCFNTVQINYTTSIDCYGSYCYFDGDNGFINLFQGQPAIGFSLSNTSDADYCNNSSVFEYIITNNDTSGFTIYNPDIILNLNNSNSVSNFYVNGEPVISGLPVSSTGFLTISLKDLQTASGYILNDYNLDGIFGEIAPGDTIILMLDFFLNAENIQNCNSVLNGYQVYTNLRYFQSVCTISPFLTSTTSGVIYNNYNVTQPTVLIEGIVSNGQNQEIKFCIDRYISEVELSGMSELILDDEILYGSEIVLPCGMQLIDSANAVWEFGNGSQIPVSIVSSGIDGETFVSFLAESNQIPIAANNRITGCLILETTFDCDTCSLVSSTIEFNGYGTFSNCEAQHQWACTNLSFCTDCEPIIDCTEKGRINHTEFSAQRTTFGWTNATMTTKVTQSQVDLNPASYNLTGAYACDTIRIHLDGEICGSVDNFTPYISFLKPTNINTSILDFVDAQIIIDNIPFPISVVSDIDSSFYWIFQFDEQTGPFFNSTTITLEANFVASKPTISQAIFPYQYFSNIKGAFFTNTGWENGVSPSLPDTTTYFEGLENECLYPNQEFVFYRVDDYSQYFNNPLLCGTNQETNILRLGYMGGSAGDEFPNEFRPINIFKDSLVFELTNPANVGYVDVVSASIGGVPLTVSQSGNLMTITPPITGWPVIDKTGTIGFYTLKIGFEVNCSNDTAVTFYSNHLHYENFLYSDGTCNEVDSLVNTMIYQISMPLVSFSFLNPIQNSLTPNTEFDFNVTNASNFAANYPWMLITYDPALITVDIPNLQYYNWSPAEIYVEVGSISSFSTISDFISITPLNCDVEQTTNVIIASGYHCSGYPLTIGEFDTLDYCPQNIDTIELNILKSNLNVDLLTSFSPSEPVNHCDGEFSIILQIYNDQKADIQNLQVQFDSIIGLQLLSASYDYPLSQGGNYDPNTFQWTMVSLMNFVSMSSLSSGDLQNGISFYDYGLDSLSTLSGILANDGVNLNNFYHLKLDFKVDCEFDVNQELQFLISGITNCNELISITSSTFIDFLPPLDNLIVNMNVTDDACDSMSIVNDIFIEVINNENQVVEDMFVYLYCDMANDGILDISSDFLMDQIPIAVSSSNQIGIGDTMSISLYSGNFSGCPTSAFIAAIGDSNACHCGFNQVSDVINCCECDILSGSPNNIEYFLYSEIVYATYTRYEYGITNFPSPISNLTNNPNHPSLFIRSNSNNDNINDPSYDTTRWYYPNSFNSVLNSCPMMAFTESEDTILRIVYRSDHSSFPHIIETKIVYPKINQFGDTCQQELPCMGQSNKNDCPICRVEDNDMPDCFNYSSDIFDNESVGIIEFLEDASLQVFPNPFDDRIHIVSVDRVEDIQMFDFQGRLIFSSHDLNSSDFIISTDGWASGGYLLHIKMIEGSVKVIKTVKK